MRSEHKFPRVSCAETIDLFDKVFGPRMRLMKRQEPDERKGWYYLEFLYVEKDYLISFENEFVGFNICIMNGEKFRALSHVREYDSNLGPHQVEDALRQLEDVLSERILFLKQIDGRLHLELEDGSYKRVKTW